MGSCAKQMGCTFLIDIHNMQMCADVDGIVHSNEVCIHLYGLFS